MVDDHTPGILPASILGEGYRVVLDPTTSKGIVISSSSCEALTHAQGSHRSVLGSSQVEQVSIYKMVEIVYVLT